MTRSDTPRYVVPDAHLVPVHTYPAQMVRTPASRMTAIREGMRAYRAAHGPDAVIFDASQGDGGMYLGGVSRDLLERATEIIAAHGTAYDYPYGCDTFRTATVEQYWQLDPALGWGPANVIAACGGRDALVRAYQAMIDHGGRTGDVFLTTRVPWISYNWGPYAVGANVLLAPGDPARAWALTEHGIAESVAFARRSGRHILGVIITSPDNPTGHTLPVERQIALGRYALAQGIDYVIYDWIYHYVTAGDPVDVNKVLHAFAPEERERLVILDGITKALGGSNIRGAHLLGGRELIATMTRQAAYNVVPHIHGQAVALAAYEKGYREAARPVVEPTNTSRALVRETLTQHGYRFITGEGGYYAFVHIGDHKRAGGFASSEALCANLTEQHGIATVPGIAFSDEGDDWLRFSFALPPEITAGALQRLHAGLEAIG